MDNSKYLLRWVRNGQLEEFEHQTLELGLEGFKWSLGITWQTNNQLSQPQLPAQLIRLSDGEIIKDTFTLREYALIATKLSK